MRDYINLYSPYRGLLLFHGLGSGKTCSSIAITEGLKHEKEVIIMTPGAFTLNLHENNYAKVSEAPYLVGPVCWTCS